MDTAIEVIQKRKSQKLASKYNILYVDDEEANLRVFKYAFKRDYNILTALTGELALEVIKEHEIHLIITDQRMPIMTGVDLLRKVVPKHPKIIRMIMSGFSDVGVLIDAVNEIGINKYLKKPWNIEDLKSTIDEELERSYGVSDVKINSDGLIEQTDDVKENLLFTQNKFLKSEDETIEVLRHSFLIKYAKDGITSDLHWVGKDRSNQQLVVLMDSHLKGNIAGTITPAIYHLIDELVNKEERVCPSRLLMEIQNELLNQDFIAQVRGYTQEIFKICVLAIDDENKMGAYAANYKAMLVFDLLNTPVFGDRTFGSFDLNETNRAFVFSNGVNDAHLNEKLLSQMIENSVHLEMDEQQTFLRQHIVGYTDLKTPDDFTLIGVDFN